MNLKKVTDKDVTEIAEAIMSADATGGTGRATYLRALIATTQDELHRKKGQDVAVQMAALKLVHERFYELIIAAAQPFVPKTQKDRPIEIHKRANFARTALSAVRGYVRAGEDVVALNAAKVTKRALDVVKGGKPAPASARRLKTRVGTQTTALLATLTGLAETDKAEAIEAAQTVIGHLTKQLLDMGVTVTRSATQAAAQGRPLKVGRAVFMPMEIDGNQSPRIPA